MPVTQSDVIPWNQITHLKNHKPYTNNAQETP
jgi:hypothetical protein